MSLRLATTMHRDFLLLTLALAFSLPAALTAQDAPAKPAAPAEGEGANIMSNPRLKNVLRTVRQEAGVPEDASLSPDEMVRQATRSFQSKVDSVDADALKSAVSEIRENKALNSALDDAKAAVKKDPQIQKAVSAVEEAAKKEDVAGKVANALEKSGTMPATETKPSTQTQVSPPQAIPVAEVMASSQDSPPALEPTAKPDATTTENSPQPAIPVPATRPAPGISGGTPTPVAMPVDAPLAPVSEEPIVPERVAVAIPISTEKHDVVVEKAQAPVLRGSTPTVPDLPELGPEKVPTPTPLTRKYGPPSSSGAYPSGDRKHMEILAKESTMDNARGVLVFTGNVYIDHPEFEIKCDKLEIQLAEGARKEEKGPTQAESSNFRRAIASGGMVEIKRFAVDEKGKQKTQIAIARTADYNAVTKDIVLSGGPPYIQDGGRFVKTNSEDAKIIMHGNGLYEVTGTTNRTQIVIPIENDDKSSGAKDPMKGLDKSLNRMR